MRRREAPSSPLHLGIITEFHQLAEQSIGFRATLIKHEQVLLAQSQQSAACNATHTIESRLSRWLLRCRDLVGADDLPLTREFIAQVLGVRLTSVSIVANTLQQVGFIRYKRGNLINRMSNPIRFRAPTGGFSVDRICLIGYPLRRPLKP
jgi:hypothetical protein